MCLRRMDKRVEVEGEQLGGKWESKAFSILPDFP